MHVRYDTDLCKAFGGIILGVDSGRLIELCTFWSLASRTECRLVFRVRYKHPNFLRVIFRGVQSVPDASHVPIAVSVRGWAESRVANGCHAPCCSYKSTLQEV